MLANVVLWSAVVPSLLAGVVLLLAWRSPRRAGSWGAAVAIGLAYAVSNWGLRSGAAGDPNAWLLYIALGGAITGLVESVTRWPRGWRWLMRAGVSGAAAALIVAPLIEPQQWSVGQIALRVGGIAAAMLVVWGVLDHQAARERGPSLAAALALLGTGGSAAVLFSGLASTAQLAGALVAALGASLVLSWRLPGEARLRSAAAPVALLLVAHWAIGLLYAELPPPSFLLLALSPLALLVVALPALKRATAVVTLVVRIAAVGAAVSAAVTLAAIPYFGLGGSQGDHSAATPGAASSAPTRSGGAPAKPPGYDDNYGY